MTQENVLKNFVKKINKLPLWIKHVLYLELRKDFEMSSSKNCINHIKKEDLFQLYNPKLTFNGEKFFEANQKKDTNFSIFMNGIKEKMNIAEIAIKNKWSLLDISSLFIKALNQNLIEKSESEIIDGTAFYLSGNIRLGEYFMKLGKISIEQLDEALRTQKYIEESINTKTGIAEILINLGFVSKVDTEGILLLKEECKKVFLMDNDSKDMFMRIKKENKELDSLKEDLLKLKKEKEQLKSQLRNVLNVEK